MRIPEWVLLLLGILTLFVSCFMLVNYVDREQKKRLNEGCENIARLTEASDWIAENYKCYIIEGNKFEEVKL